MLMIFHAPKEHRALLIALFSLALVIGGALLLLG
jgi:hypothetical protein